MADAKQTSVSASGNQCRESFQKCLAQKCGDQEHSMVEDQCASFSTWAAYNGVFASGRASMDYQLRYAPDVQSAVIGLLESLDYRIQTCFDAPNSNADSLNKILKKPLGDIAEEINRLRKFSRIIRRASIDNRDFIASNFHIKDNDGNDAEEYLLSCFERCIRDRFPNISDIILQRLARTMVFRQKRVLYRRHRYQGAVSRLQNVAPEVSNTTTIHQEDDGQTTFSSPDKLESSPSIASSDKTIPLNSHETLSFPPPPEKHLLKQKYDQATSEAQETGDVVCPYCLDILSDKMCTEWKWQIHVRNELDPYVCLFEDCDQPDELYSHSDDWLHHMHRHSRCWRCFKHTDLGSFSTSEEYVHHLRKYHDSKLSHIQLRILANMNARNTERLFPFCPLCSKDEAEVEGHMEFHITGHLRALALESLPQDELGCEQSSANLVRPQRSTTGNREDDEDRLTPRKDDPQNPSSSKNRDQTLLGLEFHDSNPDDARNFYNRDASLEPGESAEDDPIQQMMRQGMEGPQDMEDVMHVIDEHNTVPYAPVALNVGTSSKLSRNDDWKLLGRHIYFKNPIKTEVPRVGSVKRKWKHSMKYLEAAMRREKERYSQWSHTVLGHTRSNQRTQSDYESMV